MYDDNEKKIAKKPLDYFPVLQTNPKKFARQQSSLDLSHFQIILCFLSTLSSAHHKTGSSHHMR